MDVTCPRCGVAIKQHMTRTGHGEAYGRWKCACGLETNELYFGELPDDKTQWYLRTPWPDDYDR